MKERDIKTAAITGPTGAIGVALCQKLLAEGCTVYAVYRPGSPRAQNIPRHERLHRVPCGLDALPALPAKLPGGVDAFFHLAWSHTDRSGRNDISAQIANIQYTTDAVRTAAALGCRVFVGAGSQAEYGRSDEPLRPDTPAFPESGYGMAKLCAGQMSRLEARRLGIVHIWPRILSVYGPYVGETAMIPSIIRQLLAGKRPAMTDGEQKWDYLYADDAAEALWRMARLGKDGGVYPLGCGRARPLREYITILRDAIDPLLPLGFGEILYQEDQILFLEADIRQLQADTGFIPQVDFATGIQKTIEWVKAATRDENAVYC